MKPIYCLSISLIVLAASVLALPDDLVLYPQTNTARELELLRDDYEALKLEHDDLARRFSRCIVLDQKRRERP